MCKCDNTIIHEFCFRDDCLPPKSRSIPRKAVPRKSVIKTEPAKSTDPVVAAVCEDLTSRSNVGITKYGTTLADNKGDLRYWLQHAYEETLDKANYLKRAIMELDKQGIKHVHTKGVRAFANVYYCKVCKSQIEFDAKGKPIE